MAVGRGFFRPLTVIRLNGGDYLWISKPCYKKQEAKATSNTEAKNDEKAPSGRSETAGSARCSLIEMGAYSLIVEMSLAESCWGRMGCLYWLFSVYRAKEHHVSAVSQILCGFHGLVLDGGVVPLVV